VAESVYERLPKLARRLDAKADRAVQRQVMLALALVGELDPDV
jgi:hypothetical protein